MLPDQIDDTNFMTAEEVVSFIETGWGFKLPLGQFVEACKRGDGPSHFVLMDIPHFFERDVRYWVKNSETRVDGSLGPAPDDWGGSQSYDDKGIVTEFKEKPEKRDNHSNNVVSLSRDRADLFTFRCTKTTKDIVKKAAMRHGVPLAEYMETLVWSAEAPRNLRGGDDQRTKQFNFRCTPEVHRAIHWLARDSGISAADLLEELVLCEAEQREPASA